MKAGEFIEKHRGTVEEALCDYIRWFDEGEEQAKEIQKAIDNLGDVRDE